jgi:hypothetical protein
MDEAIACRAIALTPDKVRELQIRDRCDGDSTAIENRADRNEMTAPSSVSVLEKFLG